MEESLPQDIEVLISNLETWYGTDTEKTIDLSLELLDASNKARHPRGCAVALRYLGNAKRVQGRYLEAERHLEEALYIAQTRNFPADAAGILLYLGSLHIDRSEYDKALLALQESADLYESIDELDGHARALLTISNFYIVRNEPELALEKAKEALLLYTRDQNEKGTALALAVIGLCYGTQKDYSRAIELTARALPYFIESNMTYNITAMKLNLGEYFCGLKDAGKAEYYLHDALRIATVGKLPQLEGLIHCQLGVAASLKHEVERANDELACAEEIAERINSEMISRRIEECKCEIRALGTSLNK